MVILTKAEAGPLTVYIHGLGHIEGKKVEEFRKGDTLLRGHYGLVRVVDCTCSNGSVKLYISYESRGRTMTTTLSLRKGEVIPVVYSTPPKGANFIEIL